METFPKEIIAMIVAGLDLEDVASLSLASPATYYLTNDEVYLKARQNPLRWLSRLMIWVTEPQASPRVMDSLLNCRILGPNDMLPPRVPDSRNRANEMTEISCLLHRAVINDNLRVVEVLIDHGADINRPSPGLCRCKADINSALHLAICGKLTEMSLFLLARGALAISQNLYSLPEIHQAAGLGQRSILEAVFSKYPETVDVLDARGMTPLSHALVAGHWEVARWLIDDKRANTDTKVIYSKVESSRGLSIKRAVESEASAFLFAVVSGKLGLAKRILELSTSRGGGGINTQSYRMTTGSRRKRVCNIPPIHILAFSHRSCGAGDILKVYLDRYPDEVNQRCLDWWRVTPLMLAARRGDKTCVDMLLAAGAEVNIYDTADRNALMYMIYAPSFPPDLYFLMDPLLREQDECDTREEYPWDAAILQSLVGAGTNLDQQDKDGNTVLHMVLQNDRQEPAKVKEFLQVLLRNGATQTIENSSHRTPFCIAYGEMRNAGLSRLLMDHENHQLSADIVRRLVHRCLQVSLDGCKSEWGRNNLRALEKVDVVVKRLSMQGSVPAHLDLTRWGPTLLFKLKERPDLQLELSDLACLDLASFGILSNQEDYNQASCGLDDEDALKDKIAHELVLKGASIHKIWLSTQYPLHSLTTLLLLHPVYEPLDNTLYRIFITTASRSSPTAATNCLHYAVMEYTRFPFDRRRAASDLKCSKLMTLYHILLVLCQNDRREGKDGQGRTPFHLLVMNLAREDMIVDYSMAICQLVVAVLTLLKPAYIWDMDNSGLSAGDHLQQLDESREKINSGEHNYWDAVVPVWLAER